jgi:hypothetical protein
MKSIIASATLLASLAAIGSANAATITVQTGASDAGAQASAGDYIPVVDAAISNPGIGYGSAVLNDSGSFSNHDLFGSNHDIAFKTTINFGVAAAAAGNWGFRAGVDFGKGGTLVLDGTVLDFKTNDMWWSGSYADSSQFLQGSSALSAGQHTLSIYGLEGCCDGGMQVQYNAGNGFKNFDSATMAPVPEPESYAMLLAGLGLVGFMARRRQA